MKKSLTINATRDGKKVAKSFGFVNPDVANSLVGGFAQMVNALSNDTFVNAEVVKRMDTTEEEQTTPTPTPAPAGKQEGIITYDDDQENPTVTYNGDGAVFCLLYGLKDGDEADEPYFFILCLTELCQNGDMNSERDESTGATTFYLNTWDYWLEPSVYWLVAEATDNYTAASLILNH